MDTQTGAVIAYLHIIMGPSSDYVHFEGKSIVGSSIEINSLTKVVIGRNPEIATLQIYDIADDSSISRVHCSIHFDSRINSFVLTDLGSANGSYVNNERINAQEATVIKHGDAIELGRVWKNGIEFLFAIGNLDANEIRKRVVLQSDQKPKASSQIPQFPNLDVLLQEKLAMDAAEKAIPKNTVDLYDIVMQAFPDEEDGDTRKEPSLNLGVEFEAAETISVRPHEVASAEVMAVIEAARAEWGKLDDEVNANAELPILNKLPHKYDVFISSSPENSTEMETIASHLSAHGMSVWTDRLILPGQSRQSEIEKAIAESYCLLVLMSPSAKASESVQSELNSALSHRLSIFPALIEGNEANAMPIKLIGTRYARLVGDKAEIALASERLASEIKSKLLELKGKSTSI
jgi:hypothetical protein